MAVAAGLVAFLQDQQHFLLQIILLLLVAVGPLDQHRDGEIMGAIALYSAPHQSVGVAVAVQLLLVNIRVEMAVPAAAAQTGPLSAALAGLELLVRAIMAVMVLRQQKVA
jgi:hypothetical protein